jgi:hypothetical protein
MASRFAAFLPFAVTVLFAGCTTLKSTRQSFRLGETVVCARVTQVRDLAPTMVNVHDDENTSAHAGKVVIRDSGGRLIELVHGGITRW